MAENENKSTPTATPTPSAGESQGVQTQKTMAKKNLQIVDDKNVRKAKVAIPGCSMEVGKMNQEQLEELAVIADRCNNKHLQSMFKEFPKGIAKEHDEKNVTEETK